MRISPGFNLCFPDGYHSDERQIVCVVTLGVFGVNLLLIFLKLGFCLLDIELQAILPVLWSDACIVNTSVCDLTFHIPIVLPKHASFLFCPAFHFLLLCFVYLISCVNIFKIMNFFLSFSCRSFMFSSVIYLE